MKGNYRVLTPIILAALLWLPSLTTAQDDNWRKKNDVGNRYEGLIEIPQGNLDLELLSFWSYSEPFESNVELRVRFFIPSDVNKVSIIGREVVPQTQYWMEPKPGNWQRGAWNEFYPWPTSRMRSLGVEWDNLGVVVFTLPQRGPKLYLPPLIYHSALPPLIGKYSLFLQSNKTLSKLTLTLFKYENNREVQVNKWEKNDEKPASTPIRVDLDLSNVPDGMMKLVINRKIKNSTDDAPVHEYRFYHKR